ncbi:MAG: hypothetical protein ACKVHP_08960, partial [Verrucomicrobiales bacterium]
IEQSTNLQDWTPITVTDEVGDGLITASLAASAYGFVRLKVTLVSSGETRWTQPIGWVETEFHQGYQTHSVPLLKPAHYQSTVLGVEGRAIQLKGAGLDLPAGEPHFLEIMDGVHEGHRFEIVDHDDSNVLIDLASSHGTLAVIPGDLSGSSIVIRPHWTLSEVYDPGAFQAGTHLDESDQIHFFYGTRFDGVFLLDHPQIGALWVGNGDSNLFDQSAQVLASGGGCFVHRSRHETTTIRLVGQVRDHDFRVLLTPGHALVSSGFPIDSTPASLDFKASHGFVASTDPSKADQIQCWEGDVSPATEAYESYFLLQDTLSYWRGTNDVALVDRSNDVLLVHDRAFFLLLQREMTVSHRIQRPW